MDFASLHPSCCQYTGANHERIVDAAPKKPIRGKRVFCGFPPHQLLFLNHLRGARHKIGCPRSEAAPPFSSGDRRHNVPEEVIRIPAQEIQLCSAMPGSSPCRSIASPIMATSSKPATTASAPGTAPESQNHERTRLQGRLSRNVTPT